MNCVCRLGRLSIEACAGVVGGLLEAGGLRLADAGGWKLEAKGWKLADAGGWKLRAEAEGWRLEAGGTPKT